MGPRIKTQEREKHSVPPNDAQQRKICGQAIIELNKRENIFFFFQLGKYFFPPKKCTAWNWLGT
jgi:hypothetical protein